MPRVAPRSATVPSVTLPFRSTFQEHEVGGQRSARNVKGYVSEVFAQSARLPDATELARAAEILNVGKKVVILAGRGALGAHAELVQVADLTAGPIAKALLGKAGVP